MRLITKRFLLIFIATISIISLCYAFYSQYYLLEQPCPLCIAQRIIIAIIGILSLIAAIHNPKGIMLKFYSIIITGFSIFGIKVAAHHYWIMHLPLDQQPSSCGMPLEILFKRLPLGSFIRYILAGDAECAKTTWEVLGMEAPTAMIVLCSIILVITMYIFFSKSE